MSIKSLLQIILFLLIIIILGGIYFIYFYTGSLNKQEIVLNELKLDRSKNLTNQSTNQDILEEIDTTQKNNLLFKNKEKSDQKSVLEENVTKIDKDKIKKNQNDEKKIENLTKDIEYVTTNKNGEIFKIFAKYGKTNLENTNILNLIDVEGIIASDIRSDVKITSKNAEYNYSNQNSKFYDDVIISYNEIIIKCDNLDLNINENIAVGYNNVTVQDKSSFMKAKKITLNILTKDISINADDKIEITTN